MVDPLLHCANNPIAMYTLYLYNVLYLILAVGIILQVAARAATFARELRFRQQHKQRLYSGGLSR